MKLRRTTRLASAVTVAAALLLGACTGGGSDPGPTATTPPSTSATPPPTTSTTPPPTKTTPAVDPVIARIPQGARDNTPAGAEGFVKFYFDQLNKGSTEGTPVPVKGLATKSCETCAAFEKSLSDLQAQGRRYSTSSVKVKFATASKFIEGTKLVLVSIEQSSVPILDKSKKKVSSTQAGEIMFTATMNFKNRWSIDALRATR